MRDVRDDVSNGKHGRQLCGAGAVHACRSSKNVLSCSEASAAASSAAALAFRPVLLWLKRLPVACTTVQPDQLINGPSDGCVGMGPILHAPNARHVSSLLDVVSVTNAPETFIL